MAKKKGLPEWAKRKAKAGSEELVKGLRMVPCGAVAKKLYLERRRSVREVEKFIRYHKREIANIQSVRPSKRSQTKLRMQEFHVHALAELQGLRVKINGY